MSSKQEYPHIVIHEISERLIDDFYPQKVIFVNTVQTNKKYKS